MDITDEKAVARSAQDQPKPVDIARRDEVARRKGENAWGQQERDAGTDSSKSSIFSTGTTVTGGMLDHLIDEYVDQVEGKRQEIIRIEIEVKKLENRVEEFKALREDLNKQSQDTE